MGAVAATSEDQPMSEMNTTPLIDVMLVLLIMFIITIPIHTHSVPIDLPSGGPIVEKDRNKVAIDRAGAVWWNGAQVDLPVLRTLLHRSAAMDPQPELQLQPDPEARYEVVDEVLAVIRRADITAMGIVGNENYARF
jgi:biopolymer transport protein ExbD